MFFGDEEIEEYPRVDSRLDAPESIPMYRDVQVPRSTWMCESGFSQDDFMPLSPVI